MAAKKKPAPTHPRATDIVPSGGKRFLVETPPEPNATTPAISDWRIARSTHGERALVPPLDDLAGRKSLLIYEKMSTEDACVRSCLALLRAGVIGAGWRLQPGDASNAAREAADLITQDLLDLPGSFESALAEILSALHFGSSCTYKVWDLSGRVKLRKLQTLHPASVEYSIKQDGTLVTVSQQGVGGVELDPARLIHFVHDGWFGNVRGWSILRPAFTPYWQKQQVSQWLAQWMERLSNPPILVRHPQHTQEASVTKMLSVADRLQARTSVSLPEGFDLGLLESNRDPKSQFVTVLNHLDQQIARACLTHDMSGFSGGPVEGGSYALSLSQERMFLLLVEGIRRSLEACLSEQLLRDATVYGFGVGIPAPRFRLQPIQEENKLAIVAAFQGLVSAGAITAQPEDEKHLRKLLNFPEVEERAEEMREKYRGTIISLKERASGGLSRRGSHTPSLVPTKEGDGGTAVQASRRFIPSPSSPSLFSEQRDIELWRELTNAEKNADVVKIGEEMDDEAREFAATLAVGAEGIAKDVRGQVERMGESFRSNPDKLNALKPSPAVLERMRQRIEKSLLKGFATGQAQGLRAVEASTRQSPTSNGATLLATFASLDRASLSPTIRTRYDRLRGRLVAKGLLEA